jgi:hypothetical protein
MSLHEFKIGAMQSDRAQPIATEQDPDGRWSLRVRSYLNLIKVPFDAGTVAYPDLVTEVYSFRTGSKTGPVVATLTLTYEDDTKVNLLDWETVYP